MGALTPRALRKYERYLRETRGNSPNTVKRELSRVRTALKRAIRDGASKTDRDPFDRYLKPNGKPIENLRLTIDEVKQISAVEQFVTRMA